ncbi:hypothetical protein [Echinimonas agarilytica]|uniref:Lipoprotein n=1 Tax=Echinimonas agarilytica TaxID=1215918 RepID=A0AA41W6N6_9GAMM|nr:hypothetical protein [Echinimonas agarilytica]MCM2680100.1 hypothetical protein [Echinimonas agarilytica]
MKYGLIAAGMIWLSGCVTHHETHTLLTTESSSELSLTTGTSAYFETLLETGKQALLQGDFAMAERSLSQADAMKLHEQPNYQAKPALAEALCQQGKFNKGLSVLAEFDCMAKVELGHLQCPIEIPQSLTPCLSLACFGAGSSLSPEGTRALQTMVNDIPRIKALCQP